MVATGGVAVFAVAVAVRITISGSIVENSLLARRYRSVNERSASRIC